MYHARVMCSLQGPSHLDCDLKTNRIRNLIQATLFFNALTRSSAGTAALLLYRYPALVTAGPVALGRSALTVVLFLIGTGITRSTLREVGLRPLVQGVTLWLIVASLSLWAIHAGW